MNSIKRWLGIVWMVVAIAALLLIIYSAAENINSTGTGDINKPLPWIIIIAIFTPIAIGLFLFGLYAWRGAYDRDVN